MLLTPTNGKFQVTVKCKLNLKLNMKCIIFGVREIWRREGERNEGDGKGKGWGEKWERRGI